MLTKVRIFWRRFRHTCWRKIVPLTVQMSLALPRHNIKKSGPLKLVIDNSAIAKGVTHGTAWVSTGPKTWGDFEFDSGYSARIPIHSPQNASEEYREITYLTGIAELARSGHLKLFTSNELHVEAVRHPPGMMRGYESSDLNIFSGIEIPWVEEKLTALFETAEEQSARLLRNAVEPFQTLRKFIDHPKDVLDVWHIHTAHHAGASYFLTMDGALCRKFRQARKRRGFPTLNAEPILPSELGKSIGLRELPTFLFSYQEEERTFFIRHDLHLPGEKRRGRFSYRKNRQK